MIVWDLLLLLSGRGDKESWLSLNSNELFELFELDLEGHRRLCALTLTQYCEPFFDFLLALICKEVFASFDPVLDGVFEGALEGDLEGDLVGHRRL